MLQKESIHKELEELGESLSGKIRSIRKKVIKKLISLKSAKSKCFHCNLNSPKLRRQKNWKIIQMPLSDKMKEQNADLGNKVAEEESSSMESSLSDPENATDFSNDSESEVEMQVDLSKSDGARMMFVTEVRTHLQKLWTGADGRLLQMAFKGFNGYSDFEKSYDAFFISNLVVSPSKYRPPSPATPDSPALDHATVALLKKVILCNQDIESCAMSEGGERSSPEVLQSWTDSWLQLQNLVNCLFDNRSNMVRAHSTLAETSLGIRQRLDKKDGLFRMNMMGKRVNYAARSVISPDVNLRTDEIGIPDKFAKKLTYPTIVTPWNVEELRQAVINGPEIYPGANFIEDEEGRQIHLGKKSLNERLALSKTLLASNVSRKGPIGKKVLRHLKDNDVLLVNRQPTLHKPGIMAHKAKVLTGEKTIRMHYANCNTYNADFDGDEINLHYPQDEIARAEAYMIANTQNQYLVPKDGTPLRGLIQDHVIAGVLITKKDTFFTKEEYQQLLHIACTDIIKTKSSRIRFDPPTIYRPTPLWTGKQVITSLLNNLTAGNPPLNMTSKTKIPSESWGMDSKLEGSVRIRHNELIHGVLDKSQFGASAFGLIHSVFEIYGPNTAGTLLTSFGRLFSSFIQSKRAFTCGIDDLILVESSEEFRDQYISKARPLAVESSANFARDLLPDKVSISSIPEDSVSHALRIKLTQDEPTNGAPSMSKLLDNAIKSSLSDVTSKIIKNALNTSNPGIWKPFPKNNLALMTMSGAKGSNVNFSQISCLLGQQELEGRRVPRTSMGRTLPSFPAYDPTARSGGFITQRFLTGIKPQEYYFHCMAGREGLVDTAVKTSRSGYLQRCLVKHLESLTIHYDNTVRDDSNGGRVIQFLYGEDNVDVLRASYLYKPSHYGFLVENYSSLIKKLNPGGAIEVLDTVKATKYSKSIEKQRKKGVNPNELKDPVLSQFSPSLYLGAVSEKFSKDVSDFAKNNAELLERERLSGGKFEAMMMLKYINSLINPGDSVGILTAQSIGEPSTQMTLNTFHLAGFGGANVTLGIPRLREIIMTAAVNISTPLMQLFLEKDSTSKEKVQALGNCLERISISKFVDGVSIRETVDVERKSKSIFIHIDCSSQELEKYNVTKQELKTVVTKKLIPLLQKHSKLEVNKKKNSSEEVDVDENAQGRFKINSKDEDGSEKNAGTSKADKEEHEATIDADDISSDSESDSDSDSAKSDDEEDAEKAEIAAKHPTKDIKKIDASKDIAMDNGYSDEDSDQEEDQDLKSQSRRGDLPPTMLRLEHLVFKSDYFEIEFSIRIDSECLLSMGTVEVCCEKSIVRQVKGISGCVVTEPRDDLFSSPGEFAVQTDGVAFHEIWKLAVENADSLPIDVNRIASNDIAAILKFYGVEAARSAIVREISSVFAVYGISVNPRHLYLLADYMTSDGGFRALSRHGIEDHGSPLLKITFETSSKFLTDAILFAEHDDLKTASSRIVAGQPILQGTGAFDLLQPLAL